MLFGGLRLVGRPRPSYLSGVIPRDKFPTFERVLWRALRGNLYMRHQEIEDPIDDPETGTPIKKDVFVIFSHGEQLQGKIRKIADSFGATLYPAPETAKARSDLAEQVTQRMNDMQTVLTRTQGHRKGQLDNIVADINDWVVRPKKRENYGRYDDFGREWISTTHAPTPAHPSPPPFIFS